MLVALICSGRLLLFMEVLPLFHDGTRLTNLITLGWNKYLFPYAMASAHGGLANLS